MATLQNTAFLEAIAKHEPSSTAIVHSLSGRSFTYGSLLQDVAARKQEIAKDAGKDEKSMEGERVAFLIENSYDYVVTFLAILGSNAIAVPLAPAFPAHELRYILDHSEAHMLLSSSKFADKAKEVLKEGLEKEPIHSQIKKIEQGSTASGKVELTGSEDNAKGGMMLYTSGTTSRPKGVLLEQSILAAQCRSLSKAWDYSPKDRLLHVLPLHHIHGTVNAVLTPLLSGSTIEFMFPFNVDAVWNRFAAPFLPNGAEKKPPITFFTVVPTIYARLLQSKDNLSEDMQKATREALNRRNLRLNISGSAALPTPTKKAWSDLTGGNVLLERYGMTEVGMALSCGLDDNDRVDGSVGWPLPSVQARLADSDTNEVIPELQLGESHQGEIQLKGPTIFRQYWRNPEATKKEFVDGWFKTGDVAYRANVQGAGTGKSGDWAKGPAYFIQGRSSADIIKTGGEKVSALEIERELLGLPEVQECAVVALPSEAWGQKVAAVVVLSEKGKSAGKSGKQWGAMDMRRALKDRLVAYKIPQDLKIVDAIPKNAMGKVNKKQLVPDVFGDQQHIRRRSIELAEEKKKLRSHGS